MAVKPGDTYGGAVIICQWCQERLLYLRGKGWVHQDGALYRQRVDQDGVIRDDHCALPMTAR